MTTRISIAVFIGTPLDLTETRHTALYVRYPDGDEGMMHITGPLNFFSYAYDRKDPSKSRKLVALIEVTSLTTPVKKEEVRAACRDTKVRNDLKDWNCQNWVGDALSSLVDIGYVTAQERSVALDRMVDVCIDAKDE